MNFNLKGGVLLLQDPLVHGSPVRLSGVCDGTWEVHVFQDMDSGLPAVLQVMLTGTDENALQQKEYPNGIPADSGTISVTGDPAPADLADQAKSLTRSSPFYGAFSGGCVTRSGEGDGVYPITLYCSNDGKIAGVEIAFQ